MRAHLVAAAALLSAAPPALAADPSMTVTKRIAAPDGGWDYVNVSADGKTLLVSRSDGVLTLDLATGAVNPHLVSAMRTHGAVTVAGSSVGMVTSTASGGALLFDTTTGAVTATIKTGAKPDAAAIKTGAKPDAAAYDLATGMLLVPLPG